MSMDKNFSIGYSWYNWQHADIKCILKDSNTSAFNWYVFSDYAGECP